MTQIGYALSSEEHSPKDLVRWAQRAEEAGFTFAMISDHFHPWIERHPHSPFVWSTLGAIAQATDAIKVGTGVTCPIIRTHPATIAHASATVAEMMPGRFWLGVGSGEALNEHITGEYWPPVDVRRDMLEEAMDVIRLLWSGEMVDHHGAYYDVVDAKIYDAPTEMPPILVAAGGEKSAELAATAGDGIIATSPDKKLLSAYESAGGRGPRIGQVAVCWARDEAEARRTAHEWWPTAGLRGELTQELPLPRHFDQACENVSEEDVATVIVCGPDIGRHIAMIEEYEKAGFDHVYVHQIGPDQEGFFEVYAREVLPELTREKAGAR